MDAAARGGPEQEYSTPDLAEITAGLSSLRAAYLVLGRHAPDEIAEKIREMSEDVRSEMAEAWQSISIAAEALEPLLRSLENDTNRQETVRCPCGTEPSRIDLASTVVLLKQSKLAYDMRVRKTGRDELLRQYELEGLDIPKILASHAAHTRSVEIIRAIFKARGIENNFFVLDELEKDEIPELFKPAQAVICVGGDDHFKAAAHYVTDQFVVVVNSDPVRSDGVLSYFNADNFKALLDRLEKGDFLIEEWKRLEGVIETTVNGEACEVPVPAACSEISVADEKTLYTMRGMLADGDAESPLKGSGLLVVPGAGSTGWFTSAGKYLFPFGRRWLRTEGRAEYIHREPYGMETDMLKVWGVLKEGEEIRIESSSNHSPEVSVDSVWSHSFPRGSTLRLRISEKPLKVISNQSPLT